MRGKLFGVLKGSGSGPLPPLLEQYVRLRDAHADYLLLFQVGEFYETFGEDAERFSRALGLTLTHKTSKDFSTPMAGIPMRAVDAHLERLLRLGFRVAVADQVEDPATAQGLVEREVTQLMTPGTVQDDAILHGEENWLAAVASGDGYGVALLDVSTGEFRCALLHSRGALYDELARYRPSEVLLGPELLGNAVFMQEFSQRFRMMHSGAAFDVGACRAVLVAQFGALPPELVEDALVRACGAALGYASRLADGVVLPGVRRVLRYDPGAQMRLDETALRSLEVFEPLSPGANLDATLFGALNLTRTAAGRRRLKAWLRAPLLDAGLIAERHNAVAELLRDANARAALRGALHRTHDLERLATRLAAGRANARDVKALSRTLLLVPEVVQGLGSLDSRLLRELAARLDAVPEAVELIEAALVDAPPLRLGDGGLLRDGFDAELDSFRTGALAGREWIARLEDSERKRTGIGSLKVGFNSVFGYYLEVTNVYAHKVPGDYRAVQSLKDRQRFTRPDLREREREVLHFEQRASLREQMVFAELRSSLVGFTERFQLLAGAMAELDVLLGFAEAGATRGYVRPEVSSDASVGVEVVQARHAVVECALRGREDGAAFVPNDVRLANTQHLTLLTGPNMSGKSTYLRQIALLVLMAQVGSFVPAQSARLRVFDHVFTRIGASDDLVGGASTFMVEMRELARILHAASPNSLVILDEVGRGTSTFDGLAIAWAACEFLLETGATTLFATHYFELTQLESRFANVVNLHVAAEELGATETNGVNALRFYHQVLPGPASKSYGVGVAKLAGLPPETTARAEALLRALEADAGDAALGVAQEILALDVARLTPIEALGLLEKLKQKLLG